MNNRDLNKIMVVEDEPDIRTILKYSLEKLGNFNVEFAESGEKALAMVENFSPDLILLDMMMPGMDGITTLKEIRKNSSVANIPIVFMTAKAQTSEVELYLQLGAVDVIVKPFDPIALTAQLRNIWKSKVVHEA